MKFNAITSVAALAVTLLAGCGAGSDAGSSAGVDTAGAALARRQSTTPNTTTPGQTTPTVQTPIAIPNGRLLASNCFQCHGTNGVASGGFDSLAGESVSEIVGELNEMALEIAPGGGIMRPHALGYTQAQIQSLATYFASQPKR